ncbi:hypothetical protein [uncultured Bacteroides sp.]|uniref:hypothetical protein n=1 Tax=uncultured Bacteroides sp. TaxID=162156 RepID=UPI002AAC335F|nr:hypothetical protein [uncultured Bacteroides sp.]
MKKRKLDSEKAEESKKELDKNNEISKEDLLDLDSLLDVQGGKEEEDKNANCGLGCFTGATLHQQVQSQNGSENK